MRKVDQAALGGMILALFLGAGNIIFPVMTGLQAGDAVLPAATGFLLTGVGLPIAVLMIVVLRGGVAGVLQRLPVSFGLILALVIYLVLGPIFGTPRTCVAAYEMSIKPLIESYPGVTESVLPLVLYSLVYFVICGWLAWKPGRLVDSVGRLMTPVLLLTLLMLAVATICAPPGNPGAAEGVYVSRPLLEGMRQGFMTMDALAAFSFGIVVVSALQSLGFNSKEEVRQHLLVPCLLAAVGMGLIYISLFYLGATGDVLSHDIVNGGELMTAAVRYQFGEYGLLLLGMIITLACMTSAIGLLAACSGYFHSVFKSVSKGQFIVLLAMGSALVANLGLNELIRVALPVIVTLYPVMILLVVTAGFDRRNLWGKQLLRYVMPVTLIFSGLEGLRAAELFPDMIDNVCESLLPLYLDGLVWLAPTLLMMLVVITGFGIRKYGLRSKCSTTG